MHVKTDQQMLLAVDPYWYRKFETNIWWFKNFGWYFFSSGTWHKHLCRYLYICLALYEYWQVSQPCRKNREQTEIHMCHQLHFETSITLYSSDTSCAHGSHQQPSKRAKYTTIKTRRQTVNQGQKHQEALWWFMPWRQEPGSKRCSFCC